MEPGARIATVSGIDIELQIAAAAQCVFTEVTNVPGRAAIMVTASSSRRRGDQALPPALGKVAAQVKPWHAVEVPEGWIVVKDQEPYYGLTSRGWTPRMKDCVPVLVFSSEEDALSEALKQFGHAALFFGTTDPLSLDYMRAATSRMNYRCNDPATRKWMARLMRAGEWELLQSWLAEDTLGEEPLPPREDHQLDTE